VNISKKRKLEARELYPACFFEAAIAWHDSG